MNRELIRFWQNHDLNISKREVSTGIRKTNVNDLEVNIADLMLSILMDNRFNSTEKSIIGLIFEAELVVPYANPITLENDNNVKTFPMNIKLDKDTVIEINEELTTKKISYVLDVSTKTVFNNISRLKEKGIIDFGRSKFSEFGKITLNIGYLVSEFYK